MTIEFNHGPSRSGRYLGPFAPAPTPSPQAVHSHDAARRYAAAYVPPASMSQLRQHCEQFVQAMKKAGHDPVSVRVELTQALGVVGLPAPSPFKCTRNTTGCDCPNNRCAVAHHPV